jgi:hypothetical protein
MAYSYDVFVSYSKADGVELADALIEALKKKGLRAYRDESAVVGDQLSAVCSAALASSAIVVCILTPSTAVSNWNHKEVGYALRKHPHTIPVYTNRSALDSPIASLLGDRIAINAAGKGAGEIADIIFATFRNDFALPSTVVVAKPFESGAFTELFSNPVTPPMAPPRAPSAPPAATQAFDAPDSYTKVIRSGPEKDHPVAQSSPHPARSNTPKPLPKPTPKPWVLAFVGMVATLTILTILFAVWHVARKDNALAAPGKLDEARRLELEQLIKSRSVTSTSAFDALNLARLRLRETDLQNCSFSKAIMIGVDLTGANLSRSVFDRAFLIAAILTDSTANGASFRDADLTAADLTRAQLQEADFRGADLSEARLEQTNLDGAKLEGARYSRETKWPVGFKPAERGVICIDCSAR